MALRRFFLAVLIAGALVPSACTASTLRQQAALGNEGRANGPFDEEFEKLANETLERWKCPGLSIAVVDGDDAWATGYGMATFPSEPAEASTLYMVGSTTKAFTAAVMSLLVDDNGTSSHVNWDTPVSQLIRDDFVLEDDYLTSHVTIEDALSHRSGMPRHDLSYGGHYDGHYVTSRDVYCNMMYVVASYIIETITGSWLGDVIRTRILEPLDMKSTYFSAAAARKAPEHFAQGYYYHNGSYYEVPDMELHQVTGAGFIISNVLDYTKWIRAMIDEAPPISKAGHQAIRTPRTLYTDLEDDSPFTGPVGYSLGWFTSVYKGYEFYMHSGGMEAFGALVIFFPKLRYGLVAFGNIGGRSNSAEDALLWHLVDQKLKVPRHETFDWNMKNQLSIEKRSYFLENAKSIFYPSIPSPPLPLSLPLEAYTGTYNNPGYRNMTVKLLSSPAPSTTPPRLHIDRTDATWKVKIDLEHVSGEHFLARVDSIVAPKANLESAAPVEFRLGKDGTVTEIGALMDEMMGDEKIWFKRVPDGFKDGEY